MKKVTCDNCEGEGWTLEHGPWHNPDTGECEGCPVQQYCDKCKGTGKILKSELSPKVDYEDEDFGPDDIPF